MALILPFSIGIAVGLTLYFTVGWWGFLIIFPWIGLWISLGNGVETVRARKSPQKPPGLGRRIAILAILPALLLFVPIVNNENFQLEGVLLLIGIGFFSKGVIHLAVAKVFGPLIWGRGFCGWACWTAAVLEWLPIREKGVIPPRLRRLRWIALVVSVLLPVLLILAFSFDVRRYYLNKAEMIWMFAGNLVYYLLAIPMAFILKDKRAFCKVLCPASLIMKVPSRFSLIKIQPSGKTCLRCGRCNKACPMDVDVMGYISAGRKVTATECILCGECANHCPAGAIQ